MSSTIDENSVVDVDVVTTATTTATTNGNNNNNELNINNNFGFNTKSVIVLNHPIILHKITILRSSATHSGTFRAVLKELTYHIGYEATKYSLTTIPIKISVPLPKNNSNITTTTTDTKSDMIIKTTNDTTKDVYHDDYIGYKIKENISLIPILRSGLGMIDSMLELIPLAEVHHIGMYKSSIQDHPVLYYNRLPRKCNSNIAYILDPCIATASTIKSVITILKKVC